MLSLKAFCGDLGELLSIAPEAIYHRQRALIRAGSLPEPGGRGRGSGLAATPETVALLLIALLATDSLSETDSRISPIADAPFDAALEPTCRLTGFSRFRDAVAAILASEDLAARVVFVTVARVSSRASISFYRGKTRRQMGTSDFGRGRRTYPAMEIEAQFSQPVFRSVAAILAQKGKRDDQ